MTARLDRMLTSAPEYYEASDLFTRIQQAQGDEYDNIETKDTDLALQLRIRTATWALRYYEEALNIPVNAADTYDNRRGRVLSKYRSPGNFSAALVKTVAESFVNGGVTVTAFLKNQSRDPNIVGPLAGAPPGIPGQPIAVVPGLTYTISFDRSATTQLNGMRLRFLDAAGAYAAPSPPSLGAGWGASTGFGALMYTKTGFPAANGPSSVQLTIPAGIAKVIIVFGAETGSTLDYVNNIQMELGTVATAYEPRRPGVIGIQFSGTQGVPPNINDVKKAIENIVHANLQIEYGFRYMSVSQVNALTVAEMNATPLRNFAPFS